MVEVFREVRRVLTDDGTLWLNLGDSYAANPGQRKATDKAGEKQQTKRGSVGSPSRDIEGLAAKNLIGIPWRVAFAVQADGWYLRSDIIWAKPNPMPESVTDRPTKSHEYIFLLSKSERYYFDAAAIRERVADSQLGRVRDDVVGGASHVERGQHSKGGSYKGSSFNRGKTATNGNGRQQADEDRADTEGLSDTRNSRSVWEIATQPYREAHFATFPPELPRRCILAGSPRGLCPSCGAPLRGARLDHEKEQARCDLRGLPETVIEGTAPVLRPEVSCAMVGEGEIEHEGRLRDDQGLLGCVRSGTPASVEGRICDGASAGDGAGHRSSVAFDRGSASQKRESAREQFGELGTSPEERARQDAEETDGTDDRAVSPLRTAALPEWACDACGREGQWRDATPSVILDPFGGAGTTGLVADRLGRNAILIELNPKYAQMAERRITDDGPLFAEVSSCR